MSENIRIKGREIAKEELMTLDPDVLRGIIRYRTHYIEKFIYKVLAGKCEKSALPEFREQVRILLSIWKERGLPLDSPDLHFAQNYLNLADEVNAAKRPTLDTQFPVPFTEKEMQFVEKLIFTRRSIRSWRDEKVPDWMIKKIIEAGMAAPCAANTQAIRFLVVDDPKGLEIIKGDIPIITGNRGLKIVVCQDTRIYDWLGMYETYPKNIVFDPAAAAGHMLLMAHALGLGAVWLTHGREAEEALRKHYNLPEYISMPLHIAVGFPDETPIKPGKMKAEEVLLRKGRYHI